MLCPILLGTYVRMEELRKCGRCGELKPIGDFAWRRKRKQQRDNMCGQCRSAYGREHYQANRQHYIDSEARRKRARAEHRTRWLVQFFRDNPCTDCGETDPVVLEFDHLRDKKFEVGNQFASRNWKEILDEIAKCEVVCANCHRRRTAARARTLRAVLSAQVGVVGGTLRAEPILGNLAGEV
jgi:hypothetical protein